MTPFWANYLCHPPMQFKHPKAPTSMWPEILEDPTVFGIEETHRLLCEKLFKAQVRQSYY